MRSAIYIYPNGDRYYIALPSFYLSQDMWYYILLLPGAIYLSCNGPERFFFRLVSAAEIYIFHFFFLAGAPCLFPLAL